jgi:ribose transport system substrate-binding protein
MSNPRFVRLRAAWLLAALLTLALALSACGDDDDSDSSSGASTSQEADSSGVAEAQENVDRLTQLSGRVDEFPKPDEPFDPGKGRLFVISSGLSSEEELHVNQEVQKAGRAAGWEVSPICDGKFTPTAQSACMNRAVQEDYDAMVIGALDPNANKAAFDNAFKAGIPIACNMCFTPEWKDKEGFVDVSTSGQEANALANWVVADSKGEAKIKAFPDPTFPVVTERFKIIDNVVGELCPDCEIDTQEVQVADISKPGPPFWTATLAANPKGSFDYAMAPYDPMAFPMRKGAIQAGRTEIKLTGFDAMPAVVEAIASGDPPTEVTSSIPYFYIAWSAVDQVLRMHKDVATWNSAEMPYALVTTDNATEFLKGDGYFNPPDFDYQAMFAEQWGTG